jgi:pterin-4a-carbinolamine dehydratase
MTGRITARQFHEAAGVGDWRVLGEGACASFRTGSFEAGARLVQSIAELGGLDDHPPDVDLRLEGVTVRLITIADGYYGLRDLCDGSTQLRCPDGSNARAAVGSDREDAARNARGHPPARASGRPRG